MVRDARKGALLTMRVERADRKTSSWGGAKRRLEGCAAHAAPATLPHSRGM